MAPDRFKDFWRRLTLGLGHHGAAASGRRQPRDDFRNPFDDLGIRARLTLRQHLLINSFERSICSSVISLMPPLCSTFFSQQFQKYRRLVPHHLLYRLAAAATEGKMHLADGVGVQRMTRTMDVSLA